MKRVLQNLAAEAGMSGYVPPKRHRMANELLDWHHTQLIPIVEKQLMNASAYEFENSTVAGLYCVCHCESLFLKDVFDKLEFATVTWKRVHAICKKFRAVKWLKEKLADKQTSMPLKEGAC